MKDGVLAALAADFDFVAPFWGAAFWATCLGFGARFGLCGVRAPSLSSAYGFLLAFTVSRTGVPGRSKLCRIELTR